MEMNVVLPIIGVIVFFLSTMRFTNKKVDNVKKYLDNQIWSHENRLTRRIKNLEEEKNSKDKIITTLHFKINNPPKHKRGDVVGDNIITEVVLINNNDPNDICVRYSWRYTCYNNRSNTVTYLTEKEITSQNS